ncbi:MAG: hydantoinase B/oxoprolinase family protein [Chloroflexi bacterium]|nr:hydantoinase B/oxoprolinase family protein [Chloroflexota bacterium]
MTKQEVDFLTIEIMRHRLNRITDEMATTLRRVSGSPVVTDSGDYSTGLFMANGDLSVRSGILFAVPLISLAVSSIIERYSEDPGFKEGDMFLFNDPYRGAGHQSDIFIIAPIFVDGELVAWTGSFTHVVDIGAIDFGMRSTRAENVFHEGLRFPGIKIVENDRLRKDVFDSVCNMVREPDLVGLDIKGQIAAARTGRDRFLDLARQSGLATVKTVMAEIIRYSEDMVRATLRELPDGTWREVLYEDNDGISDTLYKIVITMTKEGDSLTFDFTGSSKQGPNLCNCPYGATRAAVLCSVIVMLGYNAPWNEGLTRPVRIIAPEGTLVNPTFPACVGVGTTSASWITVNGVTQLLSRMMGTSEKHKDEIFAMWEAANTGSQYSATDETGRMLGFIALDQLAGGGGARPWGDGVNTGGEIEACEAIISNVERYESTWPILYLFRRQGIDSAGPGKFRGGVGGEYCVTPYECPRGQMRFVIDGSGAEPALSYGLFGGYPAANSACMIVKEAKVIDEMKAGHFVTDVTKAAGQLIVPPIKSRHELKAGDIILVRWLAGGGYGDVLERDPEMVRRDVAAELVSPECALHAYDTVIDSQTGEVNREATEKRKQERRLKRLGIADASKLKPVNFRPPPGTRRFSEYLVMTGNANVPQIQCRKCGHIFVPVTENWKKHAKVAERPLSVLGPKMSGTKRFVLREFYCPDCATMIEVEMILKEMPPIWDSQLKMPA